MEIKIIKSSIDKVGLAKIAEKQFGDLVKAVVDIDRGVLAIGGELHADEEALLIEGGSRQEDLWGINLYPNRSEADWIEFDSMINVRPSQGNLSRGIADAAVRDRIAELILKLVRP